MAKYVIEPNLGNEFDLGVIEANKVHIKTDEITIIRNVGTGVVSVAFGGLVSADVGQLLSIGGDGKLLINAEAVQDAVGQAIALGAGLTYNDALNAMSSALGNLTFPESVQNTTGQVKLVNDALAPLANSVYGTDSAGVKGWFTVASLLPPTTVVNTFTGGNLVTTVNGVASAPISQRGDVVEDLFGVQLGYLLPL